MTRDELTERVARDCVYPAMQWAAKSVSRSSGIDPPEWQEGGNSHAQTEARSAAAGIVDRLSRGLPAIVLDAQLRALERGRLDTPHELNSAEWIATTKAAKEQAND